MEEPSTIQITVVIAGRSYPIKIKPEDEAALRNIVKQINQKINKLQRDYTKKDKQDCTALALLTYAVELHKTQQANPQATQITEISGKIQQIDNYLSQLLS